MTEPLKARGLVQAEWDAVRALLDEHPAPWGIVTVRGGKHQLVDARTVPVWTFPPEAESVALTFLAGVCELTGTQIVPDAAETLPAQTADDTTPERMLF